MPPKKTKRAAMRGGAATGRDGAFDLVAKRDALNPAAQTGADHIYRVIEIVGTSTESIEDAIDGAIERAGKTLRNLRWFEVVRTSGHVVGGKVAHFQVTLKVGFTMEDAS
jgi:flavin-binding protein dodecin